MCLLYEFLSFYILQRQVLFILKYFYYKEMIKKQNVAYQNKSQDQHLPSAGVGDYYAEPERQVIHWTAVYFQGKFYLSDPYSISKLQQIQSEIDLQKKLAQQFAKSDYHKAESQRSFANHIDTSSYSCATEKSPQKMRRNQLKAEKELQKEEEVYFKKLTQLKDKRKQLQLKKGNKNLISVKKEDIKSVKQKRIQKPSHQLQAMQQDVLDNNELFNKISVLQSKQINQGIKQHNQLPKQSIVQIKIDSVHPLNKINQSIKQISAKNLSLKIDQTKINAARQNQPQQHIKQIVNIKKQPQRKFLPGSIAERTQSIIIRNTKANQPETDTKGDKMLDLDISKESAQELNQELAQQRAGNSFFNQIHSQLYKLQHNINCIQTNPQKQGISPQMSKNQNNKECLQASKKGSYKQTQLLCNTRNILKQINQGIKQLDNIQHQKESQNKDFKKSHSSNLMKQEVIPAQNKNSQWKEIHTPVKMSKPTEPQIPKRKLLFSSNIVNYQIAESTKKGSETHQSQQKQKLQKQISVLQQVVNQLRVQRLKYQVSQNSRLVDQTQDRTLYSGPETKPTNRNLLRLAQTPPLKPLDQLSRFNVTAPNHFAQSTVSEFQNASSLTKYKLQRTKSGKIVKNIVVQAKMAKIQEQAVVETPAEQKQAQAQQRLVKIKSQLKQAQLNNQVNKELEMEDISKIQNLSSIKRRPQMIIKSQPKVQKNIQPIRKQQKKEHIFKINTVSSNQKQPINSTKNNYNSAATQRLVPSTHKILANDQDMQSSMPRTLLNNFNHSNPPKISPAQHQQHVKRRERSLNKELLDNFQQLSKKQAKPSSLSNETMDPKRRASRQGLLKTIQYKTAKPAVGQDKTSSLKKKIYEIQQEKKVNPNVQASKEQGKVKNFRSRRQSQSVRNSRASLTNKSSKSCGNEIKHKKTQNMVYVPGLNPSIHHPLSPKQEIIYQTRINNMDMHSASNVSNDVQKRNIAFTNLKMPVFPQPPSPNVTVENMVSLIKQLGSAVNIQFKDRELHRLIMKKYKNCIMLDLPADANAKLVWHYNGKIYLGGWDEEAMQKNGEGFEFIPDKFYYKGQFFRNKRQGYGIMVLFNGLHYEGQWSQGEKHGRGKFQDKSIGLYYQGQWIQGKRNGIGYLQVQGQSIYEGTFETNYRTGFGSQRFSNSDFYKGQYKMGKFHGKGIYVWASGASFQGDFVQGLKHGQGKWKSGSGEIYIGAFHQDKKHGLGRFVWENGCIYEGQFLQDKKNGKGTLKYSDGREVQGIWKDGNMVENFRVVQEDRQQPLAYRKGQKFQTVTIIKGSDQNAKKFTVAGKQSNF